MAAENAAHQRQGRALRQAAKGKRRTAVPTATGVAVEAYFLLNERWVIGPRQVQKLVKRVAGYRGLLWSRLKILD